MFFGASAFAMGTAEEAARAAVELVNQCRLLIIVSFGYIRDHSAQSADKFSDQYHDPEPPYRITVNDVQCGAAHVFVA